MSQEALTLLGFEMPHSKADLNLSELHAKYGEKVEEVANTYEGDEAANKWANLYNAYVEVVRLIKRERTEDVSMEDALKKQERIFQKRGVEVYQKRVQAKE